MSTLFEDSGSEIEEEITTDNTYAKTYNEWRQKEELNKFKTKYGEEIPNESESSSSSSEDEDEEAIQITEDTEKDFLKTLASLKTKDPKIYDANTTFFTHTPNTNVKKLQKKEQPMFIKDYERKLLLENGGHLHDSENETYEPRSLTYVEEQAKLRNTLKDALKNIDDNSDNEWGGMFKSREKTKTELKKEEEDYKQWLLGQREDIDDTIKKDLQPLKDYWNNPKLDNNEKFLRDYILNKRFMESENKDYIPNYEEIVHDSDQNLSDDEKEIEKQEEFEHKYNYRFEEPDEEFIKRYPRTIENSLRHKDKKRAIKRVETKERKQKEKIQKMEDIKQMQMLKKNEIEEKIKKLKEITGNSEIAFNDVDIEADFDPKAHDMRMQHLFSDNYYQGEEEQYKPEFPDLDEELGLENWEKYESHENQETEDVEPHCEDGDFNMDCDYNPMLQGTSKSSKEKKKRKRKSKFSEIISEPKPVFHPDDKTYEAYLDEYYKLECEDIIGDVPCRFKYRKVTPNSFGLTTEEILMANDRELNKWCSLKKAVQYRPEHVEKYDVLAFERKGGNEALKRKILPSLFTNQDNSTAAENNSNSNSNYAKAEDETINNVKNSKKSKRNDAKPNIEEDQIRNVTENPEETVQSNSSSKKRKRKISSVLPSPETTQPNSSSKKRKRKIMSVLPSLSMDTPKNNANENSDCQRSNVDTNSVVSKELKSQKTHKPQKKKKKNKHQNKNDNINIGVNMDTIKSTCASKNKERSLKTRGVKDKLKRKLNKNKFSKGDNLKEFDVSDARLKAFGFKPKKFKNKLKYGQKKH